MLTRVGRKDGGFTLVELMIVVAIVSILSAIATVGYRKYVGRARIGEAVAMLAEMTSKEVIYYSEFASYLPLRLDNVITMPSADELATVFVPTSPASAQFDSAHTAWSIANPAAWPKCWRDVGLRPREKSLYCTYLTNAGGSGSGPPGAGPPATFGPALVPAAAATNPPWFYSLAACGLTPPIGYPGSTMILGLSSNSPTLRIWNDGQ